MNSIKKLLDAVDEWIPTPVRDMDKPFLMPIESTYSIAGRGTVVTGQIERGTVKKGSEIEIIGYKSKMKTTVTGQLMFIHWHFRISIVYVAQRSCGVGDKVQRSIGSPLHVHVCEVYRSICIMVRQFY